MNPVSKFISSLTPTSLKIAGFVAALTIGVLALAYCQGKSAGSADEIIDQQEREIETQRDVNEANEVSAESRVADTVISAQQEKELSDAIKATDDPDDRRVLRGCIILRQQGRDTSDLPACR